MRRGTEDWKAVVTVEPVTWPVGGCSRLARELLDLLPTRWEHVCAVASVVSEWRAAELVNDAVLKAAWLHDVGYSDYLNRTGMHAIDGARYLDLHGLEPDVVSLVAHHTGAYFEADERGLLDALLQFDLPKQENLDALNLADLVTGPGGERVSLDERFRGIFERYEPQHPVHRAVTRSRPVLEESARRAAARLDYPI